MKKLTLLLAALLISGCAIQSAYVKVNALPDGTTTKEIKSHSGTLGPANVHESNADGMIENGDAMLETTVGEVSSTEPEAVKALPSVLNP